jgi:hypothetical protein
MTVRTGSRQGLSTARESYAAIIKGFTLTRGLQSNGLHPAGFVWLEPKPQPEPAS